MEIKVRPSRAQVAWAYAQSHELAPLEPVIKEGYVIMYPSVPGFWDKWYKSEHPFGLEAWKGLRKSFGSWVETDENSVHHGAELPKDGAAVLDCGEFSIILRQWIDDPGWWDWHWQPIALVVDPD